MRKNTRNEKVLKAITIGLAAMIAVTSTPVTAFADEGEGEGSAPAPAEAPAPEAVPVAESAPAPAAEEAGAPAEDSSSATAEETSSENAQTSESGSGEESAPESNESSESGSVETAQNYVTGNNVEPAAGAVANEEASLEAGCVPAIEAAIGAVPTAEEAQITAAASAEIVEDLGKAKEVTGSITTDLDTVKTATAAKETSAATSNTLAASAESHITAANSQIDNYNDKDTETTDKANAAITDANTANTSDLQQEAFDAKDSAVAKLDEAQTGLEEAKAMVGLAEQAVEQADSDYKTAVEAHNKAVSDYKKAADALENAGKSAAEAQRILQAAKNKVDSTADEMNRLAEQKDELQAIETQFRAFLIQYYNDGNIHSAVYKGDGTLDFEKSAAASRTVVEKMGNPSGVKGGDNVYMYGRQLMEDLIVYKLAAKGVNVSDISFPVKSDKYSNQGKKTAEGTVEIVNGRETVVKGKEVIHYWNKPSVNTNGNNNNLKVTYPKLNEKGEKELDENGNPVMVEEYYNYIFKDAKADKTVDLENGPIFLAKITKTSDGYTVERDTEIGDLDEYPLLVKAIAKAAQAEQAAKEYENAQMLVQHAQDEVTRLQKELNAIKLVPVDSSKINDLKNKLENARGALDKANENREALEEKVEEAKKAVESIDLSRFQEEATAPAVAEKPETPAATPASPAAISESAAPEEAAPEVVNPASPEDDSSTGGTTAGGSATGTVITPAGTFAEIPFAVTDMGTAEASILPISPIGGGVGIGPIGGGVPAAGVEGIREAVEDSASGILEKADEVADKFTGGIVKKTVAAKDSVKDNKSIKKINDEAVPLATMPKEAGVKMNWWWLLIILLLGATGRKMYEDYQEKKRIKAEAENSNRNE